MVWMLLIVLMSLASAVELDLVYTGATHGFSGERYTFEAAPRVARAIEDAGGEVLDVGTTHAVLAQAGWTVWSEQGLGELLQAVDSQPTCDLGRLQTVASTTNEWMVLPDVLGAVQGTTSSSVRVRRCTSSAGAFMVAGPEDALPVWRRDAFDIRRGHPISFALDGQTHVVFVAGRPRLELPRRLAATRREIRARRGALYVDAGEFVEGASGFAPGAKSATRSRSFDMLRSLSPTALVPGVRELAFGAGDLLEEASTRELPYIAANWVADSPELELPAFVRAEFRGVDVAIVGVVDAHRVHESLGAVDGVEISEDLGIVQQVVDTLTEGEDPPDLVILLTHGSPDRLAAFRIALHGVDVVIGDSSAATLRVEETVTTLRSVSRFDHAAPVTLPLDGVGAVSLVMEEGRLTEVRSRPVIVGADMAVDRGARAALTSVRAEYFPAHEGVVVPASDPVVGVPRETWHRVVCESLLEATGADAVFLAALPRSREEPGPLTGLQVARRLATTDTVSLVRIDGDRLISVLLSSHGEVPVQCGLPTGTRFVRQRGRPIDPDRSYVIATTDRTINGTLLGALFAGGASQKVADRPAVRPFLRDEQPVLLREVVVDVLDRWSAEHDTEDWPETVLAASADPRTPTWVLRARRLAANIERFQGAGTEVYAQVPETLINSPSSLTLGGEADLSVETFGPTVMWDARFRLSYAQITVDSSDPQEVSDDWRLSTSLALPVASFPRRGWMPYTEVMFDSELTPVRDEVGVLPRQADLSWSAGLSFTPTLTLRTLRVGAFVNRDLGRLSDKTTEFGGRAELEAHISLLGRKTFARASALRLSTLADLQVFANTAKDDAADLRLRFAGELRLTAGLYRGLGLSTYARTLVVQGRVPETLDPAASVTIGAAIEFTGARALRPWMHNRGRRSQALNIGQ